MKNNRSGQLLIEIIIAVAAGVGLLALGSQLVYVGLRSNQSTGAENTALGLAEETLTAVESIVTEKWQNIYLLTKSDTASPYYPQKSGGKWIVATGTEAVSINNDSYARSFTVQNICRSTSTRNITGITDTSGAGTTCTTSGGEFDPATEQITVTVVTTSTPSTVIKGFVSRWRNKTCAQGSWMSTSTATGTCPVTTYSSKTNINATTTLTICSGC